MRRIGLDRALVLLLTVEVFILFGQVGYADPPPDSCDSYCRERRFTKKRDANAQYLCIIYKFRSCQFCNSTTAKCSANPLDQYPDGTCTQKTTLQKYANITSCEALCAFPAQGGVFWCEAAKGASTYSDILIWTDFTEKIYKCNKNGMEQTWPDETSSQ